MGSTGGKEGCGRCGFSTVVDAVEGAEDASASDADAALGDAADAATGDAAASTAAEPDAQPERDAQPDPPPERSARPDDRYDPYEGAYIEVEESDLRLVAAPAVAAGRAKRWLDETAERLIWD